MQVAAKRGRVFGRRGEQLLFERQAGRVLTETAKLRDVLQLGGGDGTKQANGCTRRRAGHGQIRGASRAVSIMPGTIAFRGRSRQRVRTRRSAGPEGARLVDAGG